MQRETLNKLAKDMGICNLILSSSRSNTHNSYLGGNAFEALVGALYLDRGYDACMTFIKKRILSNMINIDKVAYKEVNFKSKLIEWTQKNKVLLEFKLLNSGKDKEGNPIFSYQILLEGVEGCKGDGFSKKESQQKASKDTLEKLKREPQFIDAVFKAKGERTKMEEEPVKALPNIDSTQVFMNNATPADDEVKHETAFRERVYSEQESAKAEEREAMPSQHENEREDIIAAAEKAAFEEEQ